MGGLPQPGPEVQALRGASRVHPHSANVESRPVGFPMVLRTHQRWPIPRLHQVARHGAHEQVELRCDQKPSVSAASPPRCSKASARRGFDGGSCPLSDSSSVGTPTDVSTVEDGQDGPARSISRPQGMSDVEGGTPRQGGGG